MSQAASSYLETSSALRRRFHHSSLVGLIVCLLGALGIFVLPLYVPMKPVAAESTSYMAGFNNQVAILASVSFSVAVLVGTYLFRQQEAPPVIYGEDNKKLSSRFIAGTVLFSSTALALCGFLAASSHLRYLGDAGYIIEVATVKRETGRALYSQMEFAYGPLLIYPEIWLSRLLHCSVTGAYYVLLVLESAVGLLTVAFLLNELPTRGSLRRAALVLLAVGAVTPHLGLNYTFFRFATPFAFLWLGMRQPTWQRCAFLLALGEGVDLLISPEIGLAMAVGVLTFGLLRAWSAGWRWIGVALIPMAVLGTLLATLGQPFMRAAVNFSRGALNLPVGPYPHLLVFLFAVVWLVPFGLATSLNLRELSSAQLLSIYAVSLAFLPSALGRSDPLHVIFNGIGFLLLSLVAVARFGPVSRGIWLACLGLLMFWNHWVNERLFDVRNVEVIRETLLPHLSADWRVGLVRAIGRHRPDLAGRMTHPSLVRAGLDMGELNGIVHGEPIATPIDLTPVIEEQLKASHQYAPLYFTFWVNVMNATAEQRLVQQVDNLHWLLLPEDWKPSIANSLPVLRRLQGFPLPYHQRRASLYTPGTLFEADVKRNWMPVRRLGDYALYEHKDGSSNAR